MNATEIVLHYVDFWNGRDAAALVGAFTKDGTYSNPDTYPDALGGWLFESQPGAFDLSCKLFQNRARSNPRPHVPRSKKTQKHKHEN